MKVEDKSRGNRQANMRAAGRRKKKEEMRVKEEGKIRKK